MALSFLKKSVFFSARLVYSPAFIEVLTCLIKKLKLFGARLVYLPAFAEILPKLDEKRDFSRLLLALAGISTGFWRNPDLFRPQKAKKIARPVFRADRAWN